MALLRKGQGNEGRHTQALRAQGLQTVLGAAPFQKVCHARGNNTVKEKVFFPFFFVRHIDFCFTVRRKSMREHVLPRAV